MRTMKPSNAPAKSIFLLDQVREWIRYLYCGLSTEKAYLYWVKFFVRWQAQRQGGTRHLLDMGAPEVEAVGGTARPLDALAFRKSRRSELLYL